MSGRSATLKLTFLLLLTTWPGFHSLPTSVEVGTGNTCVRYCRGEEQQLNYWVEHRNVPLRKVVLYVLGRSAGREEGGRDTLCRTSGVYARRAEAEALTRGLHSLLLWSSQKPNETLAPQSIRKQDFVHCLGSASKPRRSALICLSIRDLPTCRWICKTSLPFSVCSVPTGPWDSLMTSHFWWKTFGPPNLPPVLCGLNSSANSYPAP